MLYFFFVSKSIMSSADLHPSAKALRYHFRAINDGTFHEGEENIVTGVNMRFEENNPGAHMVIKDSGGNIVNAMTGTTGDPSAMDHEFALAITPYEELTDGAVYTFKFEMLDSAGNPVMGSCTATFHAS